MNAGFKADETITAMHVQMSQKETPRLVNALVKNYDRLVHKQVHLLKAKTCEPYEDLFQVGCMGLIVALRRFDVNRKINNKASEEAGGKDLSNKSVSFTSFAVPYIRGHILHYLRDKTSMVRVPRVWHEIYSKYRSIERLETKASIASLLNVTPQELAEIKLACENRSVTKELSFDIPDNSYSIVNMEEQLTSKSSHVAEIISSLSLETDLLTNEERSCIEKCYMQNMSLAKAARASRLSQSSFRNLLHQAIDKISMINNTTSLKSQ